MHPMYWSCVIAACCVMAGFQDLSLNTPSSTTPTPSACSLNEDGAISPASLCWHSIYSEQCVDGDRE